MQRMSVLGEWAESEEFHALWLHATDFMKVMTLAKKLFIECDRLSVDIPSFDRIVGKSPFPPTSANNLLDRTNRSETSIVVSSLFVRIYCAKNVVCRADGESCTKHAPLCDCANLIVRFFSFSSILFRLNYYTARGGAMVGALPESCHGFHFP